MFITDAQIHIWGPNSPARPWPQGGEARTHRVPPLDADEVLAEMDKAGVARTVIVPPSWEGDRNDLALAAAAGHPERFAVMGRLDLRNPAEADVARWLDQPGMLGLRLTFHIDVGLDEADWLWPVVGDAGIPLMIFGPGKTGQIGEVARRHRDVRIIFDHMNIATTAGPDDVGVAVRELEPLADLENVAVKVSALPCAIEDGYPFASLTPHVRRIVDVFGPERCMWGSDLSRLPCPYLDWVRAGAEGLGCLSALETEWLMGRAIARWLDWPAPADVD